MFDLNRRALGLPFEEAPDPRDDHQRCAWLSQRAPDFNCVELVGQCAHDIAQWPQFAPWSQAKVKITARI